MHRIPRGITVRQNSAWDVARLLLFGVLALAASPAVASASMSLSLSPSAATRPVEEQHTLTATLTDDGSPVAGQSIVFGNGSNFFGCEGSFNPVKTTGADGRATCSFTNSLGPANWPRRSSKARSARSRTSPRTTSLSGGRR